MRTIKIYKTESCAYCAETVRTIESKGGNYKLIDITNDIDLANEVANKTHSMTVPVVTIADSLDDLTSDNFYVGRNNVKLMKYIAWSKGE